MTRSDGRKFVEVDEKPLVCQGDIRYGDGKLILKNPTTKTMDCFNIQNNTKKMFKLWSLPASPRWEDHLIEGGPLPPPYIAPMPNESHRSRLTVLTANNRLKRIVMDTGNIVKDQALPSAYKYKEFVLDPEKGWIILNSVRIVKPTSVCPTGHLGVCNASDVFKSFIIFENIPLIFLYHFEVRKSVFGSTIQDASICFGMLLVMHQNSNIEVFSMEEIIKKGRVDSDKMDNTQESIFPVNIRLTSRPVCIFQVKTNRHHLEMNMNPWLYIKSVSGKNLPRLNSNKF